MKKIALLGLMLLAGCDSRTARQHVDLTMLTYQRDARTLECFAVVGHTKGTNWVGNSEGFTITWVPCTERVLAAIRTDTGVL